MALNPDAVLKLLPETDGDGRGDQPAIVPVAVIVHSAGGSAELYGWWQNPQSKGLESHFFIDDDEDEHGYATLYQYGDTVIRADANGEANRWWDGKRFVGAVSIETASTTHASEPWSPAQVRTLVRLIDWLCRTHDIPRRLMAHPKDHGIAWHVQFGAPGPWTKAKGKVCPGPKRIEQLKGTVLSQVQALGTATGPLPPITPTTKDPFMALSDKQQTELVADADKARAAAEGAQALALKALDEATKAREAAEAAELLGIQNQARVAALLDHFGVAEPKAAVGK